MGKLVLKGVSCQMSAGNALRRHQYYVASEDFQPECLFRDGYLAKGLGGSKKRPDLAPFDAVRH